VLNDLQKIKESRGIPTAKALIKLADIYYSQDMFMKHAFLTVSSQLQLEALCAGMSRVYTTNPSFRAEHSVSNRHLASFTHIEYELAWVDQEQLMNFSEDFVKYCLTEYVLTIFCPNCTCF
jgi:aspartyl/asparaginyl-tRNA synthetase